MAIYRGTGSASSTSDQATIDEVTTQATNAANSATSAASSATSAASSASSATSSATSAATSATTATNQASQASASASAASDSAGLASTSETNAATSATSASLSASQAAASATNASGSQTAAETAQAAAESAVTDAETAQTAAETALASTQAVYDDFDDRYLGAKTSEPTVDNDGDALSDGALFFDTTSHQMKVYDLTNTEWLAFSLTPDQLADVDTVADNIADVTSVADNMADIQAAQTSATNAANSATASANSATASANSATASASSATAAAASAAAAATSFDDFDDKYLGAKSSAPTTDNDGDALVQGALYYDTTEGSMYVYEGSSWIKASASIVDTWDEYVYTATNGQTAFTGADDNTNTLVTSDYMIVTRNGIRLTLGVGYTVTTGTVTLTTGALAGDIITITALASLQVADTLSLSQGGTVEGAVVFNGNVDGIAFSEIDSTPTTLAGYGITDAATSAQGALADSATQPGDNISTLTNDSGYITGYTVTQGDVTAHQAALSITESQISDLQSYLTSIPDNYVLNTGDAITGNLTFGDNDKAIFGAGSDLQIYHDGSDSYISDQGTGPLLIRATDLYLQSDNGFTYVSCIKNGAVSLRYNDATKLATTSTGVSVTGEVGLSGTGTWTVKDDGSGNLVFYASGTAKMKLDTSGNLTVTGNVTAFGTI